MFTIKDLTADDFDVESLRRALAIMSVSELEEQRQALLELLVTRLDQSESAVVAMHFGLVDGLPKSMTCIAAKLNISEEVTHLTLVHAIAKLGTSPEKLASIRSAFAALRRTREQIEELERNPTSMLGSKYTILLERRLRRRAKRSAETEK